MEKVYLKKIYCCGCEACSNICPQKIIKMKPDEEGFLYPEIYNAEKCINCKLCEKVCPVKNNTINLEFHEEAVVGFANKEDDVKASSSGGFAYSLAKDFFNNLGEVYCVQYTEDYMSAEFFHVCKESDLDRARGSKYIQAKKDTVYHDIQKNLRDGKRVLFFGLPCEVNALKLFLNGKDELLYTCALICHGPTSPLVQEKYIKQISRTRVINSFSVRFKLEGWKPYYIKAVFDDNSEYVEKFVDSTYGRCFKFFKRPSCNYCTIKKNHIYADITIGDFHNANRKTMKKYNENGISSIIIHSEKGQALLNELGDFYYEDASIDSVTKNVAYNRCIPKYKNREEFSNTFVNCGINAACKLKSCDMIEKRETFRKKIIMFLVKIKHFIKK